MIAISVLPTALQDGPLTNALTTFSAPWSFSFTVARPEEISDHKIIQTNVGFDLSLTPETRMLKRPLFFQPSWMSWEAWVEAFSLSWKMGEMDGWKEVCGRLESLSWTQQDEENIDQTMID